MGVINKTTETINTLLDKIEGFPEEGLTGKTPVFEVGYVTTVSSGSPANVNIRENGVDESGNPIYLIDFDIPKGKDGTTTDSEGNPVTLDWDSVLNKPDWINSKTKPSYTAEEVGALSNNTSFKTINGESILGEGNIEIQGGASGTVVGQNYAGYKNAEIFNDYENNIAAGAHAHAEGRETNATGPRAHAEGYQTKVFAADSHAEGRGTWVVGNQSHSEGLYTIAWGGSSHTEGSVETTFIVGESEEKILNDEEKIKDFLNQFASKVYPNGEDGSYYYQINFEVFGTYKSQIALGVSTHAEGINNIVCDKAGHVEGYNNICGDMIPGHGQNNTNYAPHAEGVNNRIESLLIAPHVGGGYNHIKSGNYTLAHGYKLIVENNYESAFGRYNASLINGKKVLFSYGIGDGENNRKNAISVFEDGSVEIPQFTSERIELAISNSEQLNVHVTELQSQLLNKINNLEEEIKALYDYIIKNPNTPTDNKAYVIGINLIFKDSEKISVVDGSLNITDSEIKVENETLII